MKSFVHSLIAGICGAILAGLFVSATLEAPTEYGNIDDPNSIIWQKCARLDGANSALATGTWYLNNVSLEAGDLVVDATAQAKVVNLYPRLTASERTLIQISSNDGCIYTVEADDEVAINLIDNGIEKEWISAVAGDPLAPTRGIMIVISGAERILRNVPR